MSRHKGRRRPFYIGRYIFPAHCGCSRAHWGVEGWPFETERSLFDGHVSVTVAPR